MNFVAFSDPHKVLSFVAGRGIRRRCACGDDVTDDEVIRSVRPENIYIEVTEGDKSLGMVVIIPEGENVSIHLCLKTIGNKTREIFSRAIEMVRLMKFKKVVSDFPVEYRAATKLVNEFGFTDASPPDRMWHKELKLN